MPDSDKKTSTILLVDDDQDFINYVLSLSSYFNVKIDTCDLAICALQKIEKTSYDAFIIDLCLPDCPGVEIIEKIRKMSRAPIAVVSGVYQDEDHFRSLKTDYNVNYVLDKPIYQEQLEQLFIALCRQAPDQKVKPDDEKLVKLRQQYEKTICDKLDQLFELINGLQAHPDTDSLTALKNATHKIGGSAGTFGYHMVTKLCKALENDISDKLKSGDKPTKSWLDELPEFLKNIKYHFQFPQQKDQQAEFEFNIQSQNIRNSVFIVDSEENFLNLINREKEDYPIKVLTEKDPEKAKDKLLSPDFHPRFVIIAHHFPGVDFSGFDLIESFKQKASYLPATFGILTNQATIDLRVDAAKQDIEYFFEKPISPKVMLQTLATEASLANVNNFKVLVLDDDDDICKFTKEVLSQIGMTVRAIHSPELLFKELEEFGPDLLLLDVLLPKYDGLNLLKALRADVKYQNLPIVIITHYLDVSVSETAYAEHATDLIYKPLDKPLLQRNIFEIAKQQARSESGFNKTNFTGLPGRDALKSKLDNAVAKENQGYLIAFEVDRFEDLILERGHGFFQKLCTKISNHLIGLENAQKNAFYLPPHRFVLYIENAELANVQRQAQEQLLAIKSASGADISFTAAIVPVKSESVVFDVIDQSLKQAKHTSAGSAINVYTSSANEVGSNKEILFIDPDKELQQMIKDALAHHDLSVKAFSSGSEAMEAIDQYQEKSLPALIISERKMSDMDGLTILDKVKNRFRRPVPFYFLTVCSSDRDVSEGLKHGASDYIAKPFNLTILVQKVIQETEKKG